MKARTRRTESSPVARSTRFAALWLGVIAGCSSLHINDAWTVECKTPRSWQPKARNLPMDGNANGIHDAIESMPPTALVDVLVSLNHCPSAQEISDLALFGAIGFRSKWLSAVMLEDVSAGDVVALAALANVAFVELDRKFSYMLNVSNPALKVKPSPAYSPNTIADAYPAITGAGVNVAIVDTGVDDTLHESFDGKFMGGSNCRVDPCVDGNPPDDGGHGTYVAGIALGTGGSSGMNQGIASGAGLVDINLVNGGPFTKALTRGLEKILDQRVAWGIDVVNMSLGDCTDTNGEDVVSQMANRLVEEGITVVVAAGNCSTCGKAPFCEIVMSPGAADQVISVANIDDFGNIDRSSDWFSPDSTVGPRSSDEDDELLDENKPDIGAPGMNITSADAGTVSGYVSGSGTSAAAPHVAGCAALLLQQEPTLRPLSLRRLLLSTAEDKGDVGWDTHFGQGLIDCHAALDRLVEPSKKTDLRYVGSCGGVGQDPCWLHPSVYPTEPFIVDGIPNTINAEIVNAGTNNASSFSVKLSVYNFSNGDLTYDLCTVPVDLLKPTDPPLTVSCPWTPELAGTFPGVVHACLKAEIIYPNDTLFSNNFAQHNVNVLLTSSPAKFRMEVVNKTTTPLTIDVRELLDCPDRECFGWQFTPSADMFLMQPDACPRNLELVLEPVHKDAIREARVQVGIVGVQPAPLPELDQGGAAIQARIGCRTDDLRALSKTRFRFKRDPFFTNCPLVFDVARGSLPIAPHPSATRRGDFSHASCIANDMPNTEFEDLTSPPAGSGFYYLTRAGGPLPGSWESGASAQVGQRGDTLRAVCP